MTQVGVYCYYALMNIVSHSKSSTRNLLNISLKKKSKKKNHKRCRDPASIFKTIPTFVSHTKRRRKGEEIFRRISNSFTLALKYQLTTDLQPTIPIKKDGSVKYQTALSDAMNKKGSLLSHKGPKHQLLWQAGTRWMRMGLESLC